MQTKCVWHFVCVNIHKDKSMFMFVLCLRRKIGVFSFEFCFPFLYIYVKINLYGKSNFEKQFHFHFLKISFGNFFHTRNQRLQSKLHCPVFVQEQFTKLRCHWHRKIKKSVKTNLQDNRFFFQFFPKPPLFGFLLSNNYTLKK